MMGVLMTVLGAFVCVCAIMAAYGFRGRVTTIGVDLGTTFSVVGVSINNEVKIVTDKAGNKIFPSVIGYMPNGKVVAAYDAVRRLSNDPENTIFNSKRFIGRSLDEEKVSMYASNHPFKVVKVNSTITPFGEIGFELSSLASGHPHIISPESVGTKVLEFLKTVTAEYLGHNQVNKAIIAVPAKFNAEQRQATGAAYKAAGLKVVRVLEEPTAAAVAYQLHKKSDISHILVYDFGGGTLDVSILYVSKGSVQVYATDGDETLGGSDMDMCLAGVFSERLKSMGVPLIDDNTSADGDDCDESCSSATIRVKAEQAKKELSSKTTANFQCSSGSNGDKKVVELTISRADFERECNHLFDAGMLPVTRLLDELGMERSDIDEIVLVGGTTRVPRVKEMLKAYFGKALNDHIDPDVTVAYGAASVLD
jgi:molecular chaperone DnaK (HSP70)